MFRLDRMPDPTPYWAKLKFFFNCLNALAETASGTTADVRSVFQGFYRRFTCAQIVANPGCISRHSKFALSVSRLTPWDCSFLGRGKAVCKIGLETNHNGNKEEWFWSTTLPCSVGASPTNTGTSHLSAGNGPRFGKPPPRLRRNAAWKTEPRRT